MHNVDLHCPIEINAKTLIYIKKPSKECTLNHDRSNGWEAVAQEFIAARSDIGSSVVRQWARSLPARAEVVDIGCGSGAPMAIALAEEGCSVFGIDASPTLLAAFRQRLPAASAACETVQGSSFFGRKFDGALAVGLIFLLSEREQRELILRVANALHTGARFLFSAPREPSAWNDLQTGQPSRSLGEQHYLRLLAEAGFTLLTVHVDEGGNHYFDAVLYDGCT